MRNVQSCPLNFIWLSNGVIRKAGSDLVHFLPREKSDKQGFLFGCQLTKFVKSFENLGTKYVTLTINICIEQFKSYIDGALDPV